MRGAEPIIKQWVATDVTTNPKVQQEMKEFFLRHGVKSVAMSEGNLGCPHEEGEDFPQGEAATGMGEKQKRPQKQPADQTAKEMKQLQGMWIVESAQPQSAQFTSHKSAPYMVLTVKGNTLQFEIRAEGDAVPTPRDEKLTIRYDLSKYSFAIDPTTNPKRLWTTKTEKEPEAFCWFPECGYEVTGDRFRIAANFIRGGFPDSFTATENRHVYTFRRVTSDPRTTSGERMK